MRYYPATDTVKSCRRCNPILALAKSSGPRRHGDSGRSKQAVRCGLSVIRPESRIDPTESSINTMRSMRSNASNIRVSYEKVPSLQAAIQFRLNSVRPVGTRRITSEAVASASMIPW